MNKLYACCNDRNCKTLQATILMLQVWGIGTMPKREGKRSYFDVTPPNYWEKKRLTDFKEALRTWPNTHPSEDHTPRHRWLPPSPPHRK